jgi:hypothetical protein
LSHDPTTTIPAEQPSAPNIPRRGPQNRSIVHGRVVSHARYVAHLQVDRDRINRDEIDPDTSEWQPAA